LLKRELSPILEELEYREEAGDVSETGGAVIFECPDLSLAVHNDQQD